MVKEEIIDGLIQPLQTMDNMLTTLSKDKQLSEQNKEEIEKLRLISESLNLYINDTVDIYAI